nr:hypothetical protein [Tanacetum cinerariifolium]
MSEDLFLGQIFSDNASEVWAELKETYDKLDGSIIFYLLQNIHGFRQGELTISEYCYKLNSLWREFDIMTKFPKYSCAAREDVLKHNQLIKLMQFLMGLNDVFQPIKSSLLSRENLPDVKDAFTIISREESYRGIASSSSGSVFKPRIFGFMAISNNWTNNGNKRGGITRNLEILSILDKSSSKATVNDGSSLSTNARVDNSSTDESCVNTKSNDGTGKLGDAVNYADVEMRSTEVVEGAAVAIPIAAVEEVKSHFANTLYGYCIGKRLAFPLVENYVKNTWTKYGLQRIQMHEEFFLFQFETKEWMESVMENGPWLIRQVPLILNVWTSNTDLKKEEIKFAPIWVKLHHVHIVAYSEVGISLIATQIGKPIMMDSYISNMCLSLWGRSTYARVLVEVSAESDLMESIVVAIPMSNGKGHTFASVDIKYEWKPPRCSTCKIFDHKNDKCPKNPKVVVSAAAKDDGFVEVKRKKNKVKNNVDQWHIDGVR